MWRSCGAATTPSTEATSPVSQKACTRISSFRDLSHAADAPETLRGAQALPSLMSEWRESFDEFRAEISEYIDAGDHVVCVTRWAGRGKASGAVVDVAQVDVYELRAGKIIRATLAYPDKATALEAVGLTE